MTNGIEVGEIFLQLLVWWK